MRIVLTGGGTGGHLIPFEPIVDALRVVHGEQKDSLPRKLEPKVLEIEFLGIVDANTKDFFRRLHVSTVHIPSGKLRRYASYLTLFDLLFRLPFGILKSLLMLWLLMPDVIVSKGGYGSLPVVLAAAWYRIPVVLHESDAVMGLANRIVARLATTICAGFPTIKKSMPQLAAKTAVTGIPVRNAFFFGNSTQAKMQFGLDPRRLAILVIGGSQGAQQINEILLQVLAQLITHASIVHVTGPKHYEAVKTVAHELLASSTHRDQYKVFPYLSETIDEAMISADIVVTRAGATTLAELAIAQKPALLIPLDSAANDHQRKNAAAFEQLGAARVLDPTNLGAHLFERNLEELIENKSLRESLQTNIGQLAYPKAGRAVAEIAYHLAQGSVPTYSA